MAYKFVVLGLTPEAKEKLVQWVEEVSKPGRKTKYRKNADLVAFLEEGPVGLELKPGETFNFAIGGCGTKTGKLETFQAEYTDFVFKAVEAVKEANPYEGRYETLTLVRKEEPPKGLTREEIRLLET